MKQKWTSDQTSCSRISIQGQNNLSKMANTVNEVIFSQSCSWAVFSLFKSVPQLKIPSVHQQTAASSKGQESCCHWWHEPRHTYVITQQSLPPNNYANHIMNDPSQATKTTVRNTQQFVYDSVSKSEIYSFFSFSTFHITNSLLYICLWQVLSLIFFLITSWSWARPRAPISWHLKWLHWHIQLANGIIGVLFQLWVILSGSYVLSLMIALFCNPGDLCSCSPYLCFSCTHLKEWQCVLYPS